MTTATHFRLGILEVKSYDEKFIIAIVDGIEKKYYNDPSKIYINGLDKTDFEEYVSVENYVLNVLSSLNITVSKIEKSNKSESVYIYAAGKKIRISGHKDYQAMSLVDVRIDTSMTKKIIEEILKNSF